MHRPRQLAEAGHAREQRRHHPLDFAELRHDRLMILAQQRVHFALKVKRVRDLIAQPLKAMRRQPLGELPMRERLPRAAFLPEIADQADEGCQQHRVHRPTFRQRASSRAPRLRRSRPG
ncbi:MAG: hypothetical protein ABMA13_12390 [Chthoniobacteraceae bacterium]